MHAQPKSWREILRRWWHTVLLREKLWTNRQEKTYRAAMGLSESEAIRYHRNATRQSMEFSFGGLDSQAGRYHHQFDQKKFRALLAGELNRQRGKGRNAPFKLTGRRK